MKIQNVVPDDLDAVQLLVTEVSNIDLLPLFSQQGKEIFSESIIPDLSTVFDDKEFLAVKAISELGLLGFAALRGGNFLTQLFVSKKAQRTGVGSELLNHLLNSTDANDISLRSSINAVDFYSYHGFVATGDEAQIKGIRFLPMSLIRHENTDVC